MAAAPPALSIVPDPDAILLAEWAASGSGTPAPRATATRGGLVLVAEWGWAEDASNGGEQYAELKAGMEAAAGDALYVYPASATHVTIATLSSFKKEGAPRGFAVDDAMDSRVMSTWADALERSLLQDTEAAGEGALGPFTLEAQRLELSPGAAFLHFADPSGAVERLRRAVARARDSDPALEKLATVDYPAAATGAGAGAGAQGSSGDIRASVHLPDIVHSSFARFIRTPPEQHPGGGGEGTAAEAIVAKFNALAADFQPFPVRIKRLTLANECSPYMHQERVEGTVRTFDLESGHQEGK